VYGHTLLSLVCLRSPGHVRQCIIALVGLRLTSLGTIGRRCRHSAVEYGLEHEAFTVAIIIGFRFLRQL
jgi:hypothetical protein